MEIERALSILQSPEKITVLYQDEAVWIHNIEPDHMTATVHLESNEDELQTVQITQLQEV